MRASVLAQWVTFTADFESDVDFFYLDVLGLVTIGLGLLADPFPLVSAMGLEFYWPSTGAIVSGPDVAKAWQKVKAMKYLAKDGGGAFRTATAIRATKASLEAAATRKLLQNERDVRKYFPGWDLFPAPGQLLICSGTWAMGAGAWAHWPNFCAAVNRGDWAAVATPRGAPASCQMNEANENESFKRRNAAHLILAQLAAAAVAGGDADALDVPAVLRAARDARDRARGLLH